MTYVRYRPDETYDHYLETVRAGLQRGTTPYRIRIHTDDVLLAPGTDQATAALDTDSDAILAGGDLAGYFCPRTTSNSGARTEASRVGYRLLVSQEGWSHAEEV